MKKNKSWNKIIIWNEDKSCNKVKNSNIFGFFNEGGTKLYGGTHC